jgi:hypothetical protein
MIFYGTYLGAAFSFVIAVFLVASVRWQFRFGGFWPYSVLFLLLLAFMTLSTVVESTSLSNESLERMLPNYRSIATTIDELRPFIMARNASLILTGGGFIFVLAALCGALTFAKAKRLQRQNLTTNDRNASP